MPPRKKQKDVAADHVDEAPGAPKTVAVTQVKPKRAVRGRRGFLKDVPSLPLDVLLEVSLSSCIDASSTAFAYPPRSFSASCTRATS